MQLDLDKSGRIQVNGAYTWMVDAARMGKSPIGKLVPISGVDPRSGRPYSHWAFLADPLPNALPPFETSTWAAVIQAERALARLDQAAKQIPNPRLLRQPALRREAQSTSALEGTYAPFEDVLGDDVGDRDSLSAEMREILNYVVAAETGFDWVTERPLTAGFIGQLQQELVRGTSGDHTDSGGPRDRQVCIGAPDSPIVDSRFVPAPPGDQLRAGFEAWVEWVNRPTEASIVLRAAMAHYQFETLHPFSDGNGRIGRLLIALQLIREGALTEPLLVVSPWFEARRTAYQDGLLELSATGRWDPWVSFFANGVQSAAEGTAHKIGALLEWAATAEKRVRDGGTSGVAERLAGELIGGPIITAKTVARRHQISQQGAMNALRRLASLGLLREGYRRNHITFFADPVVEILAQ